MKKLLFTGLILLLSVASFAQFSQGSMLVGGDFSARFNNDKSKDNNTTTKISKSSSISFNPKVGYFVIDNLAVGAGLGIATGTTKETSSGNKYNNTSISFIPFVRYYLPMKVYGQLQFGVGSSKNKNTVGNTTTETKFGTQQWSLAAGYAWFLTESVAIEPQIGYGSYRTKRKENNPNDIRGIDAGLFINVGLQVYLAKK